MPKNILIDTDLSFDDYVALIYLLECPEAEIRAIIVSDGVVHIQPGLENCARLLALAGKPNIPIGRGAPLLSNQNDFPPFWRFLMDYAIRILLPAHKTKRIYQDAPNLIRDQILASPTPVQIVALAPLTNLAIALQNDPSLIARIDSIIVSGGAFAVPGVIHTDIPSNPNAVSEWNFYTDPLAAKIVFESGARIKVVPLDVTHIHGSAPLVFSSSAIQRMLKMPVRNQIQRVLMRLMSSWQLMTRKFPATPIWDAAAAALALHPELGVWQELRVGIAQEPQARAGQTYEDAQAPYAVQVCLRGDQAGFEKSYLELLIGKELDEN
ncbi:MAG: nucleoside hydrolase [Anaerolineales bacterium]|nr:nucleoside hydrolase [Anaerolineales bacterium]